MRNLFSTKLALAILFGIVFLLGGAGTASAQGTPTPYIFQYENNVGPPGVLNYGPFSDSASCDAARNNFASDTTNYKNVTSCIAQPSGAFNQNADTGPKELEGYVCGMTFTVPPKFGITGCPPIITYYFIYRPTMYLLIGTGYIFDKMLSLSIEGGEGGLVAPPFVDSSWLVVRDFSNMLFIFILLYTGAQTILGMGNWRKTVLDVVIMALLINFSLFFTKVVIDAGNVLAVGIKNSISPGSSISAGLVGAFGPQVFLDQAGKVGPIDATIVFIVAAVVSGFTAYILFKAAILFSRRLIVFWGLMIMSPFAFISIALPGRANKFKEWTEELISQAFVAPIFLFFLYLIAKVVSAGNILSAAGFAQTAGTSGTVGSWFTSLIGPIIVAALIVKALQEALKFSEGFAGSTGEAFSGLVAGAMGMAGGGALSAGAGALRFGAGRIAGGALASGKYEEGSWQHKLATKATQASFDVRNLGGKDSMFGEKIGGQISKGVGAFGMGKGGGVGGVEKAAQDKQKKVIDNVPKMSIFEEQGARDRAAKKATERQTAGNVATASAAFGAKLAKEQTTKLEADVKTAQKLHDESGTAKNVASAKAAYEKELGGVVDMNKRKSLKAEFDEATATHAASGTSVALQAKLEELKKAKQAEQEAVAASEAGSATEVGGKQKTAQEIADAEIKAENERRQKARADRVEKGGWFGIGANPVAAAKIRKEEESASAKKAKEAAKATKEAKEKGESPEVLEYLEKKEKEAKENK